MDGDVPKIGHVTVELVPYHSRCTLRLFRLLATPEHCRLGRYVITVKSPSTWLIVGMAVGRVEAKRCSSRNRDLHGAHGLLNVS